MSNGGEDFGSPDALKRSARATSVEATFRVRPGLYVLGSLERGVTVYNQQVRAHNLVWALWELQKRSKFNGFNLGRVAVVGAGIAGLTTAAGFLSLFDDLDVTIFEQLWDLCPLQQGADHRWLHPRIYDWPNPGSRAPGASLPLLNWSEGRASDVARTVVESFGRYCDTCAQKGRLKIILGLRHFRITAATQEIDWVGSKAERSGAYFGIGASEGQPERFDTIIIATGFGLETVDSEYPSPSYWRNEQLSQPSLDGSRQNYLVSGFGDGALIDLSRLTIERYRQDTILYELFPNRQLEQRELSLAEKLSKWGKAENVFELFRQLDSELKQPRERLARRLRKDTHVVLHISGSSGKVKTFSHIFGPFSSFLNRMITYLLFRCGAFSISFLDLPAAVRHYKIPSSNVLCRHGTGTIKHLQAMFTDFAQIEDRITEMKTSQQQTNQLCWEPGAFRTVP